MIEQLLYQATKAFICSCVPTRTVKHWLKLKTCWSPTFAFLVERNRYQQTQECGYKLVALLSGWKRDQENIKDKILKVKDLVVALLVRCIENDRPPKIKTYHVTGPGAASYNSNKLAKFNCKSPFVWATSDLQCRQVVRIRWRQFWAETLLLHEVRGEEQEKCESGSLNPELNSVLDIRFYCYINLIYTVLPRRLTWSLRALRRTKRSIKCTHLAFL